MSGIERQSSSDVEDEAENARAGLANTLDQLRDNLKPAHVAEEIVSNARIGAATLADGLYGAARQNPIPALLIGLGAALMLGFGVRSAGRTSKPVNYGPADGMTPLRSGHAHRNVSADRSGMAPQPGVKADPWVSDGAGAIRSSMEATAYRTKLGSSRAMNEFARHAPLSRRSAAHGLSGLLHEQPLALAALGVAAGALIGAALPKTGIEDEWFGDASASLRRAARDAAQDEFGELRSVAGRTADRLRQSAADHGLSTESINDLVRDAGDHAKAAVHPVGNSTDSNRRSG